MQTINIHAAKTHLSRLVDEAAAGDEIILARAGKPVARLLPLAQPPAARHRVLGRLAGQFTVAVDFDEAMPDEVIEAFEER